MPEPCRPDSGTIQEFIDGLPGRGSGCWYMTGVKVTVTRIITEELNLCIPTPEEGDPLKYIGSVMAQALPLIQTTPIGEVIHTQTITPTWSITESFT